jgi:hypothetical protein
VGRSPDYLSVAQPDLLGWVSRGCAGGVYEGTSYRVSARALHNRGLVRVAGSGRTWTAKITAEGERLLKEQARRVEAERERDRREEHSFHAWDYGTRPWPRSTRPSPYTASWPAIARNTLPTCTPLR